MNTNSWNAKDYEKNSQAQQKWAKALIANLNLTGAEDRLRQWQSNGGKRRHALPSLRPMART